MGEESLAATFLDAVTIVIKQARSSYSAEPRVFAKDIAGRLLYVSRSFADDFGRAPKEMLGLTDTEIVPEQLAARYRDDDRKVLETGLPLTVDEPYGPAHSRRLVRTTKAPVYSSDGEAIGILGLLIDITEDYKIKDAMDHNVWMLDEVRHLAQVGTWSYHFSDDLFLCDAETSKIVSGEKCQLSSFSAFMDCFEPEDQRRISAILEGVTLEELPGTDFWIRRGDGVSRCITMSLHVLLGVRGKCAIGTVMDVTERRKEERNLRLLNWTLRAVSSSRAALTRSNSEEDLIHAVCGALTQEGRFILAWIGEPVEEPNKLVRRLGAAGKAIAYLDGIEVTWSDAPSGKGPTGTAIKSGHPVIIQDIKQSAAFSPWSKRADDFGISSSAAVPVIVDGEVIAAISVYSAEVGAFGPEEVDLLERFAEDFGFGIQSLRTRARLLVLQEEKERQAAQIKNGMEQTIEVIAATLESRDPYTAGHQSRVASIACRIAEQLGLSPYRIEGLRLAAMVHDIGKIAVPLQILAKPTRLSEIEFELIKTHTTAGYEILKSLDLPWPIATFVYQHHEYLDGSGYPNGIGGAQILLESRILTVADIVESMSSARPYRPALGIKAALAEIDRLRGSRLDSEVVDACCLIFSDNSAHEVSGLSVAHF